jgi:hypothetical protein
METNDIIGWVPWPVAAAAAAWFGIMAYKAGKNGVLWAIGGGLLGLIITTLVMGLGQAAFVPFTSAEQSAFRLKIGGAAVLIVLFVGWWFTGSLHPRLLAPWRSVEEMPKPGPKEPAPVSPPKPSPPGAKP